MVNYQIDEDLLINHLPAGTELDQWNGIHYVSLVGFMFVNTSVLGLRVPFHTNFEEVNLRFYVRYRAHGKWRRGVVFIKEIVPKWALTQVANVVYRENYQTMPMEHRWSEDGHARMVEYRWTCQRQDQRMRVTGDLASQPILKNSEAEFITEHYWGYTKVDASTTYEYEVTHPKWDQYPVRSYDVDVDFGLVYGRDFRDLSHSKPTSVFLIEGSKISVRNKRRIKSPTN